MSSIFSLQPMARTHRCENVEIPGLYLNKITVTNKKGSIDTAAIVAAPFNLASIYFHDKCQIYV